MEKDNAKKSVAKRHEEQTKEKEVEKLLIEVESLLTKPEKCPCGEDYEYIGLGVYKCPRCKSVFKNEYGRVRDFVDEYGTNYNMVEIAEMTKVPKRLIDLFVKDGRFDTVKKQKKCRICHSPISKGVYCNRCALRQIKDEMDSDRRRNITGVMKQDQDMKGEMHFINKNNL